jgi:signal transduction histidine kinase
MLCDERLILDPIADEFRELSGALRTDAQFTQFSNAVAVDAAEAPTIEHAIRLCLHRVCDYGHWVFAHAHIFSQRILAAHVPEDIWHFGFGEGVDSLRTMVAKKLLVFPTKWYSRILATPRAFIVEDLHTPPECAVKPGATNVSLKSALLVPILAGRQILGVCQYFSDEPLNCDQIFLDTMSHLAARLGHIIEHKLAEEALRSLSTTLRNAHDDERHHLAQELHDTTAQNVVGILLGLGMIERTVTLPPKARHVLSECMSLAQRSLQELRTLSYLLHPPMLDELGLAPALRIFFEGFSQRSGMQVRLDVPDPWPKLPKELELTLFRIVQEGLTNVRRHSDSATVEVRLKLDSDKLRLSVENETTRKLKLLSSMSGTLAHSARLGVGIRSMQERAERLGGHLTFEIGKNRTVLQASFPLVENAQATSP